jgi:transglutaminase/protease-like cytokinesis protein 3
MRSPESMKTNVHLLLFIIPFFCLFSPASFAQETDEDMEEIPGAVNTDAVGPAPAPLVNNYASLDKQVLAMKRRYKSIPFLVKDLSALCTNDEEKVRAFFVWITNNIGYDCPAYHSKAGITGSFKYKTESELISKRDKLYYDYASKAFGMRRAVCEGYSLIFQEMCRQADIKCEIVVGRADNKTEKIKHLRNKLFFSTNHSWNRVLLNGGWYYIDCTWASGYCDKDVRRFYKCFKPYYYLAPMDNLYETHAVNFRQTERRNGNETD